MWSQAHANVAPGAPIVKHRFMKHALVTDNYNHHHCNYSLCRLLPLDVCSYVNVWTRGMASLLNWCVHRLLNSHTAHFISRLEWFHTLICASAFSKKVESCRTCFPLVVKCVFFFFAVKVDERPLNTSFSISASFTGTRWCSNFSVFFFFLLV